MHSLLFIKESNGVFGFAKPSTFNQILLFYSNVASPSVFERWLNVAWHVGYNRNKNRQWLFMRCAARIYRSRLEICFKKVGFISKSLNITWIFTYQRGGPSLKSQLSPLPWLVAYVIFWFLPISTSKIGSQILLVSTSYTVLVILRRHAMNG